MSETQKYMNNYTIAYPMQQNIMRFIDFFITKQITLEIIIAPSADEAVELFFNKIKKNLPK